MTTDFLEKHGFAVEREFASLKTAFKARYGTAAPIVTFCSEYDALPEIVSAAPRVASRCVASAHRECCIIAGPRVRAQLDLHVRGPRHASRESTTDARARARQSAGMASAIALKAAIERDPTIGSVVLLVSETRRERRDRESAAVDGGGC